MSDNTSKLSKEEQHEVFKILSEIKSCSKELAERSRPMFDGNRFLSDSELARRLGVSKSTLANYRLKGIFGYYSLEGHVITVLSDFLRRKTDKIRFSFCVFDEFCFVKLINKNGQTTFSSISKPSTPTFSSISTGAYFHVYEGYTLSRSTQFI